MSDERDSAGSAGDVTDSTDTDETGGQTAVGTRPLRPTGKRSRRGTFESGVTDSDVDVESDDAETTSKASSKNGSDKNGSGKKKTAKKSAPRQNPFVFVWNFLKQVVTELRKVIWPNRKQMISYTTVVLVFLVFMVALIGGVDLGFAKLVGLVFG
ncbi:preprotein translocase subunit SecE [Mycolicibacterium sp. P9-64]|uniref:preprotein translocase subunit SecE n=1 Tax=Mycolicibacterium sp. P9-64 TaxID=2024612 RepID=UPI0011EFD41D|nr:preprotein translocase subunit SecE [Mycolicibacterium sp. P9-64]KAA0079098.1 preprotein translocase subunit SecE [Mycolicibacterium sp. P9-64]